MALKVSMRIDGDAPTEQLCVLLSRIGFVHQNQLTPLHIASRFHLPVVEVLLRAHADPNVTDKVRSWFTSASIIDELNSFDFFSCVKWGDTPLHEACETRQSEIVRALLAGGANLHAENNVSTWTSWGHKGIPLRFSDWLRCSRLRADRTRAATYVHRISRRHSSQQGYCVNAASTRVIWRNVGRQM
jgi:ankyrin repeat protein